MKRILFSLLICSVYFNSSAQIDTSKKTNSRNSGKWEITPVKGLKKGMGRLNLDFPNGVYWSVNIFTSENKFIINRSIEGKHKSYELTPGLYNFMLNPVLVDNVAIEEGKETRLRFGVLDINRDGDWELRSEDGETFLTSGNTPKKMALPTGKYQLGWGNNYQVVQITDMVSEPLESLPALNENVALSNYWEMSESNADLGENGQIEVILFPISALAVDLEIGEPFESNWSQETLTFTLRIFKETGSLSNNDTLTSTSNSTILLAPGNYRISINKFFIPGLVSVQKGKTTRIKAGFLKVTKSNNDIGFKISATSGTTSSTKYGPAPPLGYVLVLPLSRNGWDYTLTKYKFTLPRKPKYYNEYNEVRRYKVEIRDKQLVVNGKHISTDEQLGRLVIQY